jgi:hypothetical protein
MRDRIPRVITPVPAPSSTIEVTDEKSIGRRRRSIRNFELGMIEPVVRMFRASRVKERVSLNWRSAAWREGSWASLSA